MFDKKSVFVGYYTENTYICQQKDRFKMKQHPILHYQQQIEQCGLLVVTGKGSMLVSNEPYVFSGLIVCVNLHGWFSVEYDMQPVQFKQNDVTVLLPNHIVSVRETSQDAQTMMVMLSSDFFNHLKRNNPMGYQDSMDYHWNSHFNLTDEQHVNIVNLLSLLRAVSHSDSNRRESMMKNMMEVLFLLLKDYRVANGVTPHIPSSKEVLFSRFYDAVTLHYRKSREVRYYADLLCLTPKYFSDVIRQQTGINALGWINNYVILQAKSQLCIFRDMTVQQVAQHLGFSDQSSFSRFFKHETGLTPTEFRISKSLP